MRINGKDITNLSVLLRILMFRGREREVEKDDNYIETWVSRSGLIIRIFREKNELTLKGRSTWKEYKFLLPSIKKAYPNEKIGKEEIRFLESEKCEDLKEEIRKILQQNKTRMKRETVLRNIYSTSPRNLREKGG